MDDDTKRINEALQSWDRFVPWLSSETSEDLVLKAMDMEIEGKCRAIYIDRCRTRFNKLRSLRELKELELKIGKVININHV